ncbi:uncharacterized protein BDV14DRAFT_168828 [Aspergillus stella-maris]|uniref:uncharacterized protein n=1 Tax=Aspergillus stella-maris TaxID=1810926 RepID=UPI003CCCA1BC
MLLTNILITLLLAFSAYANVEKTIFLAPPASSLPGTDIVPDDLLVGLQRLTHSDGFLRTKLNASFPNPEDAEDRGTDSWFFLEGLNPGQRYEVRVCWLATVYSSSKSFRTLWYSSLICTFRVQQPTSFDLETYTLSSILEDPALLSAISLYSSRLAIPPEGTTDPTSDPQKIPAPTSDSVLLLRISAAADYFSLDKELMQNVPPVLTDVILDPFLMNVFPRSLVPTAGWILVVAGFAVVIARWVAREFAGVVASAEGVADDKEGKKTR